MLKNKEVDNEPRRRDELFTKKGIQRKAEELKMREANLERKEKRLDEHIRNFIQNCTDLEHFRGHS